MGKKIGLDWYQQEEVVKVAQLLLGKRLCTSVDGSITKGMIVETEAYSGDDDKACHANNQRKTNRNRIMFEQGGHAYVYLCYGIHHLFNVVTNISGKADAVLVRAIEPLEGIEVMLKRRKMRKLEKRLSSGPGTLSEALGIKTRHYGTRLDSDRIWIEEGMEVVPDQVVATPRIGVDYAGEDAAKLWRFYVKENEWVSRK